MSFVNTQPEALQYAAVKLEGIGTSLAAQNASAASSTASVAPAAADEVSALQATQFSSYGNLYQQVSAEATAINQAFVQMLGLSGDSYGTTEAANSAAATSTISLGYLGGISPLGQLTQFDQFGIIPGAITNGGLIALNVANGAGSAAVSAQVSSSSSSSGGTGSGEAAGMGSLAGVSLAGAAAPAAVGAAPVLASVGQASTVGELSVPASWAAGGEFSSGSATPATLAGTGWTSAAPHAAPVTTVPGGVPSMVSTGRTSGLGAPRYGMKPKVMPKSTLL
jgi:hypothetical protein